MNDVLELEIQGERVSKAVKERLFFFLKSNSNPGARPCFPETLLLIYAVRTFVK